MKKIFAILPLLIAMAAPAAKAQYWQAANQVSDMLSAVFTSGAAYKGYADVSYLAGVGGKRANILSISTTQGAMMSKNFFMGVGMGVDVMFTSVPDSYQYPNNPNLGNHGFTTTGAAIPMFTDFRFFTGMGSKGTGFYADLKIGASFLTGNNYIQVGDGYLTKRESFYLKPSVGMRIPLSSTNPKLACNIGVTYQLTTSNYWYISNNNITLNSLGLNVGIEW